MTRTHLTRGAVALAMAAALLAPAAATPQATPPSGAVTTVPHRTELVMLLPDGTRETVFVEWYVIDQRGQPVQISSVGAHAMPVRYIGVGEPAGLADFAIVTLPQHTDAATLESLRHAWQLHGLSARRIYFEGGGPATV